MADKQITDVLERVKKWPKDRQEDAARVLLELEAQESYPYRLTDEQVAEVQRRLADPDPRYISLEEVEKYFEARRT